MPPALCAQLDHWMPDQPAIGEQRAVGGTEEGNDAVQQQADDLPLPLCHTPGYSGSCASLVIGDHARAEGSNSSSLLAACREH